MQSNNLPICIFIQIVDSDDIRRLGACKGWRNSSLALEKVVATSHVAIPSANQGKLMKAHKGQLFCAVNLCFESYSRMLSSQVGLHTPHSSTIALSFRRPWKNQQIIDSCIDCRSKLMQTFGTWFPTFAKKQSLLLQCEYISWTSWWKQCWKYLLQGKEGVCTCPQTEFSRYLTNHNPQFIYKSILLIYYPWQTPGINMNLYQLIIVYIVIYQTYTNFPASHLFYPSPAMWPTSADHRRWEAPHGGRSPNSPTESPQLTKCSPFWFWKVKWLSDFVGDGFQMSWWL